LTRLKGLLVTLHSVSRLVQDVAGLRLPGGGKRGREPPRRRAISLGVSAIIALCAEDQMNAQPLTAGSFDINVWDRTMCTNKED